MNPMLFPSERGNPLLAAGEYINEAAERRRAEREARREEIGNRLLQTWPAEAARAAYEAVTLPGDVYAGRVDPMSDEAIGRAAELTGLLALQAPLASRQGTVGIFGGRGARTADLDALARAQSMADSGADRRAIWDATGWFRGPDGQWRFEIDDSGAQWTDDGFKGLMGDTNLVRARQGLDHPQLAEAYPEMMDRTGIMFTDGGLGIATGNYSDGLVTLDRRGDMDTLLHEFQHGVQDIEGFVGGGVPSRQIVLDEDLWRPKAEAYMREGISRDTAERLAINEAQIDQYRRLAGEVEARNVQTRRDMTPDQRRASPPWETQDVPDDMQIVRRR